ncbi:MAG TPA: glycosyltransferase family 87 protein [Tepidisphaeraceae bacterium]|nr:glycosyltransferase family 87 protein [Tepidisphaeraceae bacterium]
MRLHLRFHPLRLIGLALLCFWAYFWYINLQQNKLIGRFSLWWMPKWSFLGLDFLNSYFAVPHWLQGGNIYVEDFGDPIGRPYAYAPVVLVLFLWCNWIGPMTGIWVWTGISALIIFVAACAVWQTRMELRLPDLSVPFILAVTLWSMPVVFAMERGNNDVLIILILVFVARLLRRDSLAVDVIVGALMAFAVWAKLYPILLLPGLIVLGHFRAAAFAAMFGPLIGLIFLRDNLDWIEISRRVTGNYPMNGLHYAHSISGAWPFLWRDLGVGFLARIPGLIGATVLLAPLAGWVSWDVYRCRQRVVLAYPYLLWLSACATFWFPVSMDYKLISLPLAALALWHHRDRLLAQALLGVMLLWWQPLALPIDAWTLLLLKFCGLIGVAVCLVDRTRELDTDPQAAPIPAEAVARQRPQMDSTRVLTLHRERRYARRHYDELAAAAAQFS